MKIIIAGVFVLIICLVNIPSVARGQVNEKTYSPPPEKGYVYVLVEHKGAIPGYASRKMQVRIVWGSRLNRVKTYDPGGLRSYSRTGVIIRLEHKKNDSIPITVRTDGGRISIAQLKSPPQQWNDRDLWERDEW